MIRTLFWKPTCIHGHLFVALKLLFDRVRSAHAADARDAHENKIIFYMPPPCSWEHQPLQKAPSGWDWVRRSFTSRSCAQHHVASPESCLANRSITLMGDSAARDFALALASVLSGVPVATAENETIGMLRRWQNASNGTRLPKSHLWESLHPNRRGVMSALYSAIDRRQKPTDVPEGGNAQSCGAYTHPQYGWRVTNW